MNVKKTVSVLVVFIQIIACVAIACGPPGDWFRKAKKESDRHAYHSIMGSASSWQYYRPYLEGKILLREKKYTEAVTHYKKWSSQLRKQGGGKILNNTALWAITSANLRSLVLTMTTSSPEIIFNAMKVCDFIDASQRDMAIVAANKITGPLGLYMNLILTEPKSSVSAIQKMKSINKSNPVYPLFLYRSIRYEENYTKAIIRADTFLAQFPDHYLADDVMGWKARCYLKLNKRSEAASCYLDVLLNHPNGDMINACLESLQLFTKEDFTFIEMRKNKLFRYVKALFRKRTLLEGPARLIKLLATCELDPTYQIIVPEILSEIVTAGITPLYYSPGGDGTSYPYGYKLIPKSQAALKRLAREFPTHRWAAYMSVTHLRADDLSSSEITELARYCDDHLTSHRLMRLLQMKPQEKSTKKLFREERYAEYLKLFPLGPEFFEILSCIDFLTIEHEQYGNKTKSNSVVEAAFRILPELSSIPMTEDEYRLYALLYLRMCTMSEKLKDYPDARNITRRLSFNDMEKQELDLLDGVFELKKFENSTHLKKIVRESNHPYRLTAGKVLAYNARERKDWPLLLWSSVVCDVYDAFGLALNNISPQNLDIALNDKSGEFARVRDSLILRRAGYATLKRQVGWLKKHETEVKGLCRQSMHWFPAIIDKVIKTDNILQRAKTPTEIHAAQYDVATATYMKKTNNLDFHYDCYLRLKELSKNLLPEEKELKTKVLFSMATSLQKARDGVANHVYYSFRSFRLGDTWHQADALKFLRSDKSLTEIAHLYEQVANEHPDSTLADDALYWAAYTHYLSGRHRFYFLHSPNRKDKNEQKEIADRVKNLMERLLKEYPDGDFAVYAKRWQKDGKIGLY